MGHTFGYHFREDGWWDFCGLYYWYKGDWFYGVDMRDGTDGSLILLESGLGMRGGLLERYERRDINEEKHGRGS